MAETDARERTESPTPKRLEEARKKGQVPRSRDLAAAAVVLAGGLGLSSIGSLMGGHLLSMMHDGLSFGRPEALDSSQMLLRLEHGAAQGLWAATPLLALLLAAAVLAPLALGGWTFSTEATGAETLARLNPISPVWRAASATCGLIELCKSLARFMVVAVVGVMVLHKQFHSFAGLSTEPPRAAIGHALWLVGTALIALGGALGAIAVIDVPLSLWQYHKGLRMSREEIREEHKQTDR